MKPELATRPAIRPNGIRRFVWLLEPRRDPGWIAFFLNRLTGVVLVLYLLAHMVVLSQITAGPAGWDALVRMFGSRPFLAGDVLLVGAIVFHGLNGFRVILLTAGYGTARTGLTVAVTIAASAALTALAGWAILSR